MRIRIERKGEGKKCLTESRIDTGNGLDLKGAEGCIRTKDEDDVAPGFFKYQLNNTIKKRLFGRLSKELGLDFESRFPEVLERRPDHAASFSGESQVSLSHARNSRRKTCPSIGQSILQKRRNRHPAGFCVSVCRDYSCAEEKGALPDPGHAGGPRGASPIESVPFPHPAIAPGRTPSRIHAEGIPIAGAKRVPLSAPPKEDARTALPKGQARDTKHDRAKRRGTTGKRID